MAQTDTDSNEKRVYADLNGDTKESFSEFADDMGKSVGGATEELIKVGLEETGYNGAKIGEARETKLMRVVSVVVQVTGIAGGTALIVGAARSTVLTMVFGMMLLAVTGLAALGHMGLQRKEPEVSVWLRDCATRFMDPEGDVCVEDET